MHFEEKIMKKEKKDWSKEVNIDYENIDITKIMEQIRSEIASRPKKADLQQHMETKYAVSPTFFSHKPEGPEGLKQKIKILLLKIMKPFSPMIKLLVLPVHQEVRETIEKLYLTDKHLELLVKKHDGLDLRVTDVENRLDLAFEDLNRAKEYVRLLHSLSHNIVVELTKLKIEEENLKIKARILEKDFEFLGQREKAVEKKVFE